MWDLERIDVGHKMRKGAGVIRKKKEYPNLVQGG